MKLIKFTIFIIVLISFVRPETKHRLHKKLGKFLTKTKSKSRGDGDQVIDKTSQLAKDTNILDLVPDPDPSIIDLNIGSGPVYFNSWIKYFKYASDEFTSNRPTTFFKNNEFYAQQRKYPNAKLDEKEDGEYKYIKSEQFFYMMVFYDRINILTSRLDKFQTTFESFTIDQITPVVESVDFKGGITDFGAFSEGFCFKIDTSKIKMTTIPKGTESLETWIICTESAKEKLDLMTMIRKIKIKNQREQGITISSTIPPIPETLGSNINKVTTTPDLNTDGNNFGVRFNVTNQKVIDGYWIVLQEWSQCSLKCGGGVSTLQRMCVPPKHGGNQCEGPAILTKPCNIQPCPFVKELKRKQSNTTIESPPKKPIVKIMPFTDRPQRYTKCIVKESDMLYTKIFDEKVQYVENIQIPVRVVMNNRTLSIFASTDYKSNLMSFDLQRTTLAPSKPHKNCFILTEGEGTEKLKQAEMCPFGFDRVEEVFQEWAYDFNLFKFQCKTAKETIDLDNADAKALDDKFKKKVEQANLDIVEEKSKLINEKLKKKESKDINVQMQKTNQMALQAIQKELTLEEMIKREEEEREQVAEREMLQEIDSEKHKHDCLVKAIKEKELEDQYNIKNQQDEKQLQKIRDSAAKEVIIKRSELKSAVLKMRKKALRKKAQLAQQLQAVRYQMANDMNNLYKDGKTENCVNALKDDQGRSAYCEVSFPDDYVKLTNCKNEEDFCVLCCENEFGDMHMDKRQNCIDTLCAPKPPSEETGRWVWTGGNKDLVSDNPFAPNAEKSATPYSSTPPQKLGLK